MSFELEWRSRERLMALKRVSYYSVTRFYRFVLQMRRFGQIFSRLSDYFC